MVQRFHDPDTGSVQQDGDNVKDLNPGKHLQLSNPSVSDFDVEKACKKEANNAFNFIHKLADERDWPAS